MIARARWVLPIDRGPIDGGWVDSRDGVIVEIGRGAPPRASEDLGDAAILPGLVNAHTHLELSWMAGRVPPQASMAAWIRQLVAVRQDAAAGDEAARQSAAIEAAAGMRRSGTALVGDISNTGVTPAMLSEAGLGGVVFHELLGFNHPDPQGAVRAAWASVKPAAGIAPSVVAHAPYSVSPALFRAIAAARREAPLSVHLAESPEELELLETGGGVMRELLEDLGAWTDTWQAPACDPVRYLSDLGYLVPGTLAVHGVHLTDDGLKRLRQAGAVIVTCPRSNVWVGGGSPPAARFFAAGLSVAIGTDSLASAPTLSVFDELAELRRIAPGVPASRLLDSATRGGAEALGRGDAYGTIATGKRSELVAVRIPSEVSDVEEYLVSGIGSDRISWIPS